MTSFSYPAKHTLKIDFSLKHFHTKIMKQDEEVKKIKIFVLLKSFKHCPLKCEKENFIIKVLLSSSSLLNGGVYVHN